MGTTDPLLDQETLDREQEEQWSDSARELVPGEIDIRALLLDDGDPDLERLHNLIMMC